MEDARIESLAETMRRTGLATSASDAIRMAKNIIGTEQKVSSGFNRYSQPAPQKTKSYQEEIDDLIRKTSPEFKEYHVPIKGYRKEEAPAVKKEEKPAEVFFELEEPSSSLSEKTEAHSEVFTDVLSENENMPLSEVLIVKDAGDVMVNDSFIAPSVEESQDEFIVPVQKEAQAEPDNVQKPQVEQLFKEIKEDKSRPREVKNPIEKIDLMNFFKAG